MKEKVVCEVKQVASDYLQAFEKLLHRVDLAAVERVVDHLRAVRDRSGTVFIAGNGGSAATASHWVNDLGKATKASGAAADAGHEPERQYLMVDRAGER